MITATTERNLTDLIAAEVHEGKTLEYKREIALGASDQKRKFLRSIVSFANASGGDFVFGMEAENGKPVAIKPLINFEPDGGVRVMRDMIRAHIDPPLFGVEFQPIPISGGWVVVVRVPRSWNPPHMVTFDGDNRFYTRDSNGCVSMNIPEIREAFLGGQTIKERVQQYRFRRLNTIRGEELPMKIPPEPVSILHVQPFRSLVEDHSADLKVLDDKDLYPPSRWQHFGRAYDIEGIYGTAWNGDGTCGNYMFVNRSGSLEGLTTEHIVQWNGGKFIGNPQFEQQWATFLRRCVDVLRKLEAEPPIAISLSLLDVKGYCMYSGPRTRLSAVGARPIQQRDLNLPSAVVTTFDQSPEAMLKPIFDALWNSCGIERSLNYDENGDWAPRNWE